MIDYVEYLNLPEKAAIVLVAGYLILLVIGAILDLKKKAVPDFMNIRRYFARKKQERETIAKMPAALEENTKLLQEVLSHYSNDNITKRDDWMSGVDRKLADTDDWRRTITEKLDKTNAVALAILIENKRSELINFASYVIDPEKPVTHEQFNRAFKTYKEYEAILKENKLTNGEVVTAMRIINESYEIHMRNRTFIEDIRDY